MFLFFKDTIRGMKRRRKEIRLLAAVEFAVIAFISAALLFQENSEHFNFENGKNYYGDWVVAEIITNEQYSPQLTGHAYFDACGTVKSGIEITGKNGNQIASAIGAMDEMFLEIGHIRLREGRFPEKDDEIAMEATLLMELGLPLDTGQEITLNIVHDDGSIESRTFLLVGVMKKSAGLWSIGSVMPMAAVTEEAMKQIDCTPVSIYCYRLSEKYKDVDTEKLYENLAKKHGDLTSGGWDIAYNDYLYSASFWGTPELYDFIKKMILVMGMAALSFLLAAYIQKRKKYYYNLRIIGISRFGVKRLILFESLCFSVISGVLAFTAALIFGAVISLILSVSKEISYFYEVSPEIFLDVILSWFLIFAGSNLIAMLITGRKRLYENTRTVSVKPLLRKGLNRLKPTRRYSGIFIREHRVFWVRSLFGGLVCLLFSSLIMLCGARIWEGWYIFIRAYSNNSDICAVKIADIPAEEGEYFWDHGPNNYTKETYTYGEIKLSEGYSDAFFERLDQIGGIDSLHFSTYDDAHLFEWENMEEDPYIAKYLDTERGRNGVRKEDGTWVEYVNTMRDVIDKNTLAFGYKGWYVCETEKIFEQYNNKYGNGSMDYEAFVNGEQAFLIMHDTESFVGEGTKLSIAAGENKVDVTVACVIKSSEIGLYEYATYVPQYHEGEGMYMPIFYLIGSENLGRRIAEAEGKEYEYNRVEANMDFFANYQTTVKQCTQLFTTENSMISSYYETKQQLFSEWLTKLIMYGSFIILLFVFFIMIRSNLIQAGFTFQGGRLKRLRMLGMGKNEIKRMYLLQGLYESRRLWIAILITYAIRVKEVYELYKDNGKFGSTVSLYVEKLKAYVTDVDDIVRYSTEHYVNIWICFGVLAVIIAVNIATRYFVVRTYLNSMDED